MSPVFESSMKGLRTTPLELMPVIEARDPVDANCFQPEVTLDTQPKLDATGAIALSSTLVETANKRFQLAGPKPGAGLRRVGYKVGTMGR